VIKVFDLEFNTKYYYLKHSRVVTKISFNNRSFYSKFKKIEESLSPLLFTQHLQKDYAIAVPLVENNRTNYLVIEYKGQEVKRFYHLVHYLFKTLKISEYYCYENKDAQKLQVFISVANITIEEADERLDTISKALVQKMPMSWKCLPSLSLPKEYNIVTLPTESK